jgi:hypothetical protein
MFAIVLDIIIIIIDHVSPRWCLLPFVRKVIAPRIQYKLFSLALAP